MITVTCNGCFDGLHHGHMFFLGFCRAHGDRMIVGINSDEYIRRIKHREPIPSQERRGALMAHGFISDVIIFHEDEPSVFIWQVKPDVHCTSVEYMDSCPESMVCSRLGVNLVYAPRVGDWSSSSIRKGGDTA